MKKTPSLFLCAVCFLSATAQISAQPAPLGGFDKYVTAAVQDWEVPGLAIAVVKDGKIVFSKGFGVRELGKTGKVNEHSLFAIGSTTKAMTAAAIGMLVDEGKVKWDDPVTKHLPDFQLYDPWVTREVTVRDLLTHRAGLGNADLLWYGQGNSREEIIRRLRLVEPATSMRTHFTYQNIMYVAAGQVVAAASGMPWEDFVRQRILAPLEMKDTVVTLRETESIENVAAPHDRIDGKLEVIENASVDIAGPAGSIWSSVHDMSQWMILLLEGKGPNGAAVLDDKVVNELFTPQFIVDRDEFYPTAQFTKPHWTTYGLGWFQHDYTGRAVDFHTGSIDGMVAIAGLIRDEHLGVFVLANLDHAEVRHALMYRVFDLYGDGPSRDWSSDLKKFYGERREKAEKRSEEQLSKRVADTTPSHPLEDFAGAYSDPLFGPIQITHKDGLRASYGPALEGRMEHWHYNTFRIHWDARWRGTAFATFALDAAGKPSKLEVMGTVFKRQDEGGQ